MSQHNNPYDRGPYRAKDIPGLVVGAAVIGGGVYALVRLLVGEARAEQAAALSAPATVSRGARWDR